MPLKKSTQKSVSAKKVAAKKGSPKNPVKPQILAVEYKDSKAVEKSDTGIPLSVVIRRRIEAQKARFHANDNIAQFI